MSKRTADIIVLRHAEFLDKVSDKTFAPLTVKGVADAALVGCRIHHNLGVVKGMTRILAYVSPAARTVQTAALVVPETDLWKLSPEIGYEASANMSPTSPLASFVAGVKAKQTQWDVIVIVTHQHLVPPITEALSDSEQLAAIYEPCVIAYASGFIITGGVVHYVHP